MEFSSTELGKIVGTEVLSGKIRTSLLDVRHLSYLINIEMKMLNGQLNMSPEFRREVWGRRRSLGIINTLTCSL